MEFALTCILISCITLQIHAQDVTASRNKDFNLENSLAIKGYDPIAYIKENKAVKGKKDHEWNYQGITYYFSNSENATAFKKNPAAYEPQYGGWCAYVMAKGEKVTIDPETFKILNNKLYLFYNRFFNNTLKLWNKDENNLKEKADKNWNQIYH